MPFSTYLTNKLNNHVFRGDVVSTSFDQPTELYLSLHDESPTEAGTGATEIAGGSYARQLVTFSAPNGDDEITNATEIVFTLPTVAGGITHLGIWDAVTGGNMLAYDTYATNPTTVGDTITWPIGALTIRLIYTGD